MAYSTSGRDVSVAELRHYMKNDLNILIKGPHGVGKSMKIMEACRLEGLNFQMLNAATLDVYTDFVGVPVPDDEKKSLLMLRQRNFMDANVIFIDELNRANDVKTTNATLELVQFGSINGEKLPNLRVVWAAINPDDEDGTYDVQALDPALVDRFHLVLEMKPKVSVSYLSTKFGADMATALQKWYQEHDPKKTAYISPRRLEYIGTVYKKNKGTPYLASSLAGAMPPEGRFDVGKLKSMLDEATLSKAERDKREAAEKAKLDRLAGLRGGGFPTAASSTSSSVPTYTPGEKAQAVVLLRRVSGKSTFNGAALRRGGVGVFIAAMELADAQSRPLFVKALGNGVSPIDLVQKWSPACSLLTASEAQMMVSGWSASKRSQFRKAISNTLDAAAVSNLDQLRRFV